MTERNDPCPCGSGKKYKKCCLLKEKQEKAERRQEMPSPDETPPAFPGFLPEAPAAEPDPLMQRMNAWWETFKAAPYDKKWELAFEALGNEPELMDGEMVFEVGNTLLDQAIERGESERLDRLLRSFEERAPEAYEAELSYVLQWRFTAALARKAWPDVEEAFIKFSESAGDDLDIYYRLIHALAYHGRLELMVRGMGQARPAVEASNELVAWAAGEFDEMLGTYELLLRLRENPDLTADDPELLRRMAELELTVVPEQLDKILAYRSGRVEPAWEAADLILSPGGDFEDDPAKERLTLLLMAWTHYAAVEEGIPLTKAEMVCDSLYRYLVERSEHALGGDSGTLPGEQGKKKRGRRRKARKPQRPALIPDRRTVDHFLGEMGGLFSFRYYEACAFFELLPLWLRFLKRLGMIDDKVESQALGDLQGLHGEMVELAERALNDPAVAHNLRAWPAR